MSKLKKKPNPRTHLTIPQVARRWGMSTTFIRRSIWAGELPAKKFGRMIRISVPDAEAFAASLPDA